MIDELRIRALGVIEDATITFGPRLTVVTGETGAGKTMVLSGLGLVMGGRAEAAMVRRDAERADVDGRWVLSGAHAAAVAEAIDAVGGNVDRVEGENVDRVEGVNGGGADRGEAAGAGGEQVAVTLGRSISSSGRSRAFAGGRGVPAATLAELTEPLVTVHGQADQLQLRDARSQRELLDRFAGQPVLRLRAEFEHDLLRLRAAQREQADLLEQRQEREREAVLLRHGIAEIEAVAPEPGEDVLLKEQSIVLANATDLLVEMGAAHAALDGDADQASVRALLQLAQRHVERAGALDPRATELSRALTDAMAQVDALVEEVAAYAASLEADPASQAQVEERRHRLSDLKRRYGPELEDVLSWWRQAVETVAAVDGTESRLEELQRQVGTLREQVRQQAERLSALRREAAVGFAAAVTAELRELAMPDAVVVIEVVSTDDEAAFTAAGADQVSLLLTPHAGSDSRPLGAGASGGELSRVMLAIEVVLAGLDDTPTFVFDEVDAGIGGRVAVEVGRRLARLARGAQVIVVTHLPQVAAFADAHIVVTKDSSGQVTGSSVVEVTGQARVAELVRMLSGLEGSASGAEHAAELLQLAESERAAT